MPAKRHKLKSWIEFYAPIVAGVKPFDVREDDRRNFAVGDTIEFIEWDADKGKPTGNSCERVITYVLKGGGGGAIPPLRGIARDYVVLGLTKPAEA